MISLIILVGLSFSFCVSDEQVRFAAVIYRHGDRTPVATYPTDPWRNESLWPVKFGELTNIGKMQHYKLGQWMRKRYSHLISEKFDPTEIYVRSTDVDRTLMSAQANLAGMYPPTGSSVWNEDLMWQPIPVHTVPEKEDEILAMKKPCPAYNQELKQFINSKPYKERLSKYQKLMDYLSAYTGMKVKNYIDINDIYSDLFIESLYNLTLPEWTHNVFPDQMVEPAGYSFKIETSNPELTRLKIGPLLKEITSRMMESLSEEMTETEIKKSVKLAIYSAHDLTVANLLNGLGVYDGISPVYTSTVFFELILDNSTSSYYIRISYRNSTDIIEPNVLSLPYCGKLCQVDRFIKLYENILSVDFEHDCKIRFPPLGLSLAIGLCLFVMIYLGHKLYFLKVSRQHRLQLQYTCIRPMPQILRGEPLKVNDLP